MCKYVYATSVTLLLVVRPGAPVISKVFVIGHASRDCDLRSPILQPHLSSEKNSTGKALAILGGYPWLLSRRLQIGNTG